MTDIEKPDVVGATRRAETIRNGMIGYAAAMEAIGEAFDARDWVALGHKDWDTYCEKEFSEKRLKLTREQREQAVLAFRGAGMSTRAIAAALGVSDGTVRNDLSGAQNYAPETVTGADGKTYAATRPAPRDAPVDEPEEDHRAHPGDEDDTAARLSSDAQPPADVVSNDAGSDETGAEDAASQQSSAEVDLPQEQQATGVSVAAPAGDPERSGGNEEQGRDAAPVSAPPRTGETDADRAEREEREYREARSLEFATGLVNVRMRLEPDPVHWYQTVYVHGLYHARDLPRVKDSFTPTGMRQAAGFLLELADHLDQIGEEL